MSRVFFYKGIVTLFVTSLLCGGALAVKANFYNPQLKHVESSIQKRSLGNPKADVWVVEYMDYQCHECAKASQWLKEFVQKYPKRVYLQVRFDPLVKSHKNALQAAIMAHCAPSSGKFWALHEALFNTQSQWENLEDPREYLKEIASALGLSSKKYQECVTSALTRQEVLKERQEALDIGVRGTPTFFVNGQSGFGLKELKKLLLANGFSARDLKAVGELS